MRWRNVGLAALVVSLGALAAFALNSKRATPTPSDPTELVRSKTSGDTSTPPVGVVTVAPTEVHGAAPLAQDIETPFKRKRFAVGALTIGDPGATYRDHIERARSGDADAMLVVADAVFNCTYAAGGRASADHLRDQALITNSEHDELVSLVGECQPIFDDEKKCSHADPSPRLQEIARQWREQAAAAGNQIARLQVLVEDGLEMYEAAALADKLVDGLDYRVLDAASRLVGETSEIAPDDGDIESEKWAYLSCLHNTECSPKVFRRNLDLGYSPAAVQDIVGFANKFQSIGSNGYTFTSRLMDQYHGDVVPTNQRAAQFAMEQLRQRQAAQEPPSASGTMSQPN